MIDYQDYANSLAQDLIETMPDDEGECYIYDLAAVYAEGSEHVIYYYKAHEFVQWMNASDFNHLEGEIEAGGSFVGYNELASLITYHHLRNMISSAALKIFEEKEAAWLTVWQAGRWLACLAVNYDRL